MAKGATKPVLVAVDTNVLLDQALGDEDVLDALATIRGARGGVRFLVTPTVIQELMWLVENGEEAEVRQAALGSLQCLHAWGYEPLNLVPVGHGVVEQIGLKMRFAGIIPDREVHDSHIIAEAALVGCALLLSSDSHLLEAQAGGRLIDFLKECDVGRVVIDSPRGVVSKFFLKK